MVRVRTICRHVGHLLACSNQCNSQVLWKMWAHGIIIASLPMSMSSIQIVHFGSSRTCDWLSSLQCSSDSVTLGKESITSLDAGVFEFSFRPKFPITWDISISRLGKFSRNVWMNLSKSKASSKISSMCLIKSVDNILWKGNVMPTDIVRSNLIVFESLDSDSESCRSTIS